MRIAAEKSIHKTLSNGNIRPLAGLMLPNDASISFFFLTQTPCILSKWLTGKILCNNVNTHSMCYPSICQDESWILLYFLKKMSLINSEFLKNIYT